MVDFDAGDDAFLGEKFGEGLAVVGGLVGGFFEENDAIDVVFEVFGGEEKIAVIAAMFGGVGNVILGEFFVNGATTFVGSEDAFGVLEEGFGGEFEVGGFKMSELKLFESGEGEGAVESGVLEVKGGEGEGGLG